MFLSSLFHKLNYRMPGRSYYLETDAEQRIALGRIYSSVSDASQPWPSGTRVSDMREFTFDCVAVDDQNARHPVLRMCYLDYAGELLECEQPGGTALKDLAGQIETAHALLGMIDGHRVLQLLRGQRAGHVHFQQTLQPMFGFMQGASCPIHLVLTKWDLVRDFGEPDDADDQYRLDRVIEALLKFEHIRSLVYVHSKHQVVRLIPVSAVGSDFVHLNADGTMSKLPDGELRPTNVHVPLCAALPDLFKQVERTLDQSTLRDLNTAMHRNIRGDMAAIVAAALGRPAAAVARTVLQGALGRGYGLEATSLFMEWMARPLDEKGKRMAQTRNAVEREVAERQRLRGIVMDDFNRTVLKLEAILPQSELSRNW